MIAETSKTTHARCARGEKKRERDAHGFIFPNTSLSEQALIHQPVVRAKILNKAAIMRNVHRHSNTIDTHTISRTRSHQEISYLDLMLTLKQLQTLGIPRIPAGGVCEAFPRRSVVFGTPQVDAARKLPFFLVSFCIVLRPKRRAIIPLGGLHRLPKKMQVRQKANLRPPEKHKVSWKRFNDCRESLQGVEIRLAVFNP